MCQFCHQHGDGKKWYLKAEHYSEDLLSDMERRGYMNDFIREIGSGNLSEFEEKFKPGMHVPAWLRSLGYSLYERRYRRDHFGQVVPLDDLEKVFDLASSIVRMPCICRKNSTGRNDAAYCIGLGIDPNKLLDIKESFLETFALGPNVQAFEKLTTNEALDLHRDFEKKGLIHTLWTFKTPFIGAICNCDRADCLAMVSYRYGFHLFFRAEYVANVVGDRCVGCRSCLGRCQFGAIGYSAVHEKAFIDPFRCYGCGICRSACEAGAIELLPRLDHPVARGLW
jgi:Pyruvate/2-oxoacid:ferredoxin oxidoreductase delta subunit